MAKETRKPRKIRFSPEEETHIQSQADRHCKGNFSKYVRIASINCPPYAIPQDIPKKKKGQA